MHRYCTILPLRILREGTLILVRNLSVQFPYCLNIWLHCARKTEQKPVLPTSKNF